MAEAGVWQRVCGTEPASFYVNLWTKTLCQAETSECSSFVGSVDDIKNRLYDLCKGI